MFELGKEIPSLETCKRLKKFGYPQNADGLYFYRYYYDEPDEIWIDFKNKIAWEENPECYYAPSITEFKRWIEKASVTELVLLQHELRKYKEDKPFLDVVLKEIKKRDSNE